MGKTVSFHSDVPSPSQTPLWGMSSLDNNGAQTMGAGRGCFPVPRAAMTKDCNWMARNNGNLLSCSSRDWKSTIKVTAGPWEGAFHAVSCLWQLPEHSASEGLRQSSWMCCWDLCKGSRCGESRAGVGTGGKPGWQFSLSTTRWLCGVHPKPSMASVLC